MHVRAPASSANLGPGFDCLGIAIDLPFELVAELDAPDGFHPLEPTHPAMTAFVAAGGDPGTTLRWRSPIPPGRGLGYSGAARVAGAFAAGLLDGLDDDQARRGAHLVATEHEGHPDNAAASAYGGLTVAVGDQVISLPVPGSLLALVWSPVTGTSTDASRSGLVERVSRDDAVFSVGRAALWVAAIATGDLSVLRTACQDKIHQPERLASRPESRAVLETMLADESVLAAWLSGSGPTIAALAPRDADLGPLLASLPEEGHARTLEVASAGVHRLVSTSS